MTQGSILEKIELLMSQRNMNKRQLSVGSGIPYSTLCKLWTRGSDSIRLTTFRALCNFFGVTMDSMFETETASELSPSERAMIKAFRIADEVDQESVRRTLKIPGKITSLQRFMREASSERRLKK